MRPGIQPQSASFQDGRHARGGETRDRGGRDAVDTQAELMPKGMLQLGLGEGNPAPLNHTLSASTLPGSVLTLKSLPVSTLVFPSSHLSASTRRLRSQPSPPAPPHSTQLRPQLPSRITTPTRHHVVFFRLQCDLSLIKLPAASPRPKLSRAGPSRVDRRDKPAPTSALTGPADSQFGTRIKLLAGMNRAVEACRIEVELLVRGGG